MMPKYRGFMNEVSLGNLSHHDASPISSGAIIDRFQLNGLGAAFSGPLVQAVQRAVALQTAQTAPAPAYVPTISPIPIYPGKIQPGIPGDIRDITARIQPGEAIVDDPDALFDDMATENGVPGVDDSGAFPYGDPSATGKTALVREGGNQGLVILAILAALLLGG